MKSPSIITIGLCAVIAGGAVNAAPVPRTHFDHMASASGIRLSFSNTDASDVLQALSLKSGASIVFPAQMKRMISINVTAPDVQTALGYITAAAGLAFREVGSTYVVAEPKDLRQALEPFATRAHLPLNLLSASDAASMLESALPYLTARPAGDEVLVIGSDEDIAQARTILADSDRPGGAGQPVTRVVELTHVSSAQVAKMLLAMYPGIKVQSVGDSAKPGGVVGIAGPRALVEEASRTVKAADIPGQDENPDRRYSVYHIKYSSAPQLVKFMQTAMPNVFTVMGPERYTPKAPSFTPLGGNTLSASTSNSGGGSGGAGGAGGAGGGAAGSSGGGSTLNADPTIPKPKDGDRSTTLVLYGLPQDLNAAIRLLDKVDIPPKQVMVRVEVVDTSPERAENLGMQFSWTPFQFLEAKQGTPVASATANTTGPDFAYFSRVPWSFQSILNAMVTHSDAKILADPSVGVLDDDSASIFIGDTLRTTISQAGLSGTTLQVVEFPVGIALLVRPRVNANGEITMHVHPVVSTVTSIGTDNLPQTASREAETTVMVKSGQTVVIGGLIKDEMTKTISAIPFLSNIPIIGELFKNTSTDRKHSEILVFITPYIVDAQHPGPSADVLGGPDANAEHAQQQGMEHSK
ncbi:MAG: hypothetical protein KGJ62_12885 [Armatimonadetes bacterium]|nr:hypothetical protein [Armatimonadota bacterium]MDE2206337.1 hypothetical protein [Armatimonadota bacterium]